MPPPRFRHGYDHDVFISYTHTDDQLDAGCRWVTEFARDLKVRLEIVSGHSVDIWRDEEKLGAADRFNESIAAAIETSAVLLVVLSPGYFNSTPCQEERAAFYDKITRERKESAGRKARVVKVAKFRVALERYPQDLRELLEHRFYVELPGPAWREFRLSEDPDVRRRYNPKVDDVAQEIAGLLSALEPAGAAAESRGSVYLAEATSDVEPQRDVLRRQLVQLGFDVQPTRELRLLPAREIRSFIADTMHSCRLTVHPVGGFYGFVPEGAGGKSVVQMQLELAQSDARNGDLGRIIWVPEGLDVQEEAQKEFLKRIRTEFAGHGFEFLERPFRALETCVADRLRSPSRERDAAPSTGVYLICDDQDRAVAKGVRSFIFNQRCDVEWTPFGTGDLADDQEHQKLLRRNRAHLVLHGKTSEAWIQDRIRELTAVRQPGIPPVQAIYLTDPRRQDKDDILVRDITLIDGYPPSTVGGTLEPFLDGIRGADGLAVLPRPAAPQPDQRSAP
jgi:hypothetical protein